MYLKRELKKALKKMKNEGDYAYQAGINDTLELLDEMEQYIILDHKTEQVYKRTVGVIEIQADETKPDLSIMEAMAKAIKTQEKSEAFNMSIPYESYDITDAEMGLTSETNPEAEANNQENTQQTEPQTEGEVSSSTAADDTQENTQEGTQQMTQEHTHASYPETEQNSEISSRLDSEQKEAFKELKKERKAQQEEDDEEYEIDE